MLWYDDNIFKIIRVKQELVITERRIKVDNIEQLTTKAEENDDNAIGIPEKLKKQLPYGNRQLHKAMEVQK